MYISRPRLVMAASWIRVASASDRPGKSVGGARDFAGATKVPFCSPQLGGLPCLQARSILASSIRRASDLRWLDLQLHLPRSLDLRYPQQEKMAGLEHWHTSERSQHLPPVVNRSTLHQTHLLRLTCGRQLVIGIQRVLLHLRLPVGLCDVKRSCRSYLQLSVMIFDCYLPYVHRANLDPINIVIPKP